MFFYLATVRFQSCTLNVNKIDVVQCFRKLICAFSLTCFKVGMCKISDKSYTFSLNYSNLFRGPPFFGTQCSSSCRELIALILVRLLIVVHENITATHPLAAKFTGFESGNY